MIFDSLMKWKINLKASKDFDNYFISDATFLESWLGLSVRWYATIHNKIRESDKDFCPGVCVCVCVHVCVCVYVCHNFTPTAADVTSCYPHLSHELSD